MDGAAGVEGAAFGCFRSDCGERKPHFSHQSTMTGISGQLSYLHLLTNFLAARVLQLVPVVLLERNCEEGKQIEFTINTHKYKKLYVRCLHKLSFSIMVSTNLTSLNLFRWFSRIFSGSPPLSARNRSTSRTIFKFPEDKINVQIKHRCILHERAEFAVQRLMKPVVHPS